MRRVALVLALSLVTVSAHADPWIDQVVARCPLDGRLLPAARALRDDPSASTERLQRVTEATGLFAPTLRSVVLRAGSSEGAFDAWWAGAVDPRAMPRCGVAGQGGEVAVVMAPRGAEVQTRVDGDTHRVTVFLPAGVRDATVVAIGGDGEVVRAALDAQGEAAVTLPPGGGERALQVIATRDDGPIPLATWHAPGDVAEPTDAPAVTSRGAMLAAINTLRDARAEPRMRLDPLLTDVAQRYAERLAARGSVTHAPSADDTPVTRVLAAGLRTDLVAENVSRARSLGEAHARLLASPSHRANLVHADLDALGIGVSRRDDQVYVVELMARRPSLGAR